MTTFDARQTFKPLEVAGKVFHFYSLAAAEQLGLRGISHLPFSLKCILENVLRQSAEGRSNGSDVDAVVNWLRSRGSQDEIAFMPARMLIPESSGIPMFGDLAAMRDAMIDLGGDASRINPTVPIDFIIDHSLIVDVSATPDAEARNAALELGRNRERYDFVRWVANAFDNVRVFPPGAGICHQINLEHLAQVVCTREEADCVVAFPDSLVGMDSHTPMINSMGIVGWGVGGLEGGAAALGEPVSMLVPPVVGCKLTGKLRPGVTATDLVLLITQVLRRHRLAGKFVEFFGSGVDELSLPERATIANMSPETGATMGFFAIDNETIRFLRLTGRDPQHIALVEAYAKAQGLWGNASNAEPWYTETIAIDLSDAEPSVSGPKRPDERVPLAKARTAFEDAYPSRRIQPSDGEVRDGDIIIAAITSCANTSNPAVMIGAGLLARNAAKLGMKPKPWVKTSLAPGSRVVADYLEASGLQSWLDALGFNVVGFGCTTCMGNSGPIASALAHSIEVNNATAVAVLSGNRNFEGRVHVSARAAFLASPPLVVAYALAGTMLVDLTRDALGSDDNGDPVYLQDIWPDPVEVRALIDTVVTTQRYRSRYAKILENASTWRTGSRAVGRQFDWDPASTFIRRPPFFVDAGLGPTPIDDIVGARVLGVFGDMLTTDHISPIGTISRGTPASDYLTGLGIAESDFVNYASRRLNHDVMIRGTFANIRLQNEMTPGKQGSSTIHLPSGDPMSIADAAERYRLAGVPLVILAGREYGAGSSRDWAAKGTRLLGVRAVLAESFERIHRSNLLGMGVLPLEFTSGATRQSLALDGSETIDIAGFRSINAPRHAVGATITHPSGRTVTITLLVRLDTTLEVEYFRAGGIMNYMLYRRLKKDAE